MRPRIMHWLINNQVRVVSRRRIVARGTLFLLVIIQFSSREVSGAHLLDQLPLPGVIHASGSSSSHESDFCWDVFPQGFLWGLGSSAYQIEGGSADDGKGESIWDRFSHEHSDRILNKTDATISCDSYHKYKEDVQLLKSVGAKVYRFSISWSRVLPKGTTEIVNKVGLKYYSDLIDELKANGIEPMVCLFHWDLPQNLEESGGWLNEEVISLFGDYSRLVYDSLGDRVKYWITLNEPYTFCYYGYDVGSFAPGLSDNPGTDPYLCVHSMIKAHALAYQIYKEEFYPKQHGKVGISLDNFWQEPADPGSKDDILAAEQSYIFRFGWIAHPLFHGEYPPLMREIIDEKSKTEKAKDSRLPKFDEDWTRRINGSVDFLGLNHFTSQLVRFSNTSGQKPSWASDSGTIRFYDPSWPSTGSTWLKVYPQGLRKALNKIKEDYKNPEVIITENGVSDQTSELQESLNDNQRVEYHRAYINEMLKAVKIDGCRVTGYVAWALLDGFEWSQGYTEKFGVFHVNHTDPGRPRRSKKSARALQKIFLKNGFPLKVSTISVPAGVDTFTSPPSTRNSSHYRTVLIYSAPAIVVYSLYYAYSHV